MNIGAIGFVTRILTGIGRQKSESWRLNLDADELLIMAATRQAEYGSDGD
jgi:hypothetical protein